MHINEVHRILTDTFCKEKGNGFEIKTYNDSISCESDFVLLYEGKEYAYFKFDETGKMSRKAMAIHEEKMGTAGFYIVVRDTADFIPVDLNCTVYPRNDMNAAFVCDTSDLLQRLQAYQPVRLPISVEDVVDFFAHTYSSLIRGRMQVFLSKLREESNVSNMIEDQGHYFMLTPAYERLFFCTLLGSTSGLPKRVCRYTSLPSLFRTLSEKRQSMCSVVCMNDKTENDYALQFLSKATPQSNAIQRLKARSSSQGSGPQCFILSGSRMGKKDDLNMWRLYGDNSKGVCLWYRVEEEMPENFFLSRVSYAKNGSHAELTYLAGRMGKSVCGRNFEIRSLQSWLHFFKPSEYAIEEEVRLLYELSDISLLEQANGKWVYATDSGIITPVISFPVHTSDSSFPLVLERIVLGPNLRERDINQHQLRCMIRHGQIKVTDDFEITCSSISSYR